MMKKIIVDKTLCIGCGACVAIDENHFEFDSDGLSVAKNEDVNNVDPTLASAIETCPTNAIKVAEVENDNAQELSNAA